MQSVTKETMIFSATNYPLTVLRGCAAIDEIAAFKLMPDGFIRVLMKLIKKIDVIHPEQAIFARRETLARETGKSKETVSRALRWLEEEGFISRNKVCRRNMKGSDSPIQPTKKFIEAIGFAGRKITTKPPVEIDASRSVNQIHNINKQSAEPSAKISKQVVIGGYVIPVDLEWLISQGKLKPVAVLKLMKLAKGAGKLLSDVACIVKNNLIKQQIIGHSLFAYIRKLCTQDKDFAYAAKQQNDTEAKQKNALQEKDLIIRKSVEWANRTFASIADPTQVFSMDKQGFVYVYKNQQQMGSRYLDINFVNAVLDGKLRIMQ